ncbi:ubiquitin carboxyl-terminal hydrolase 40-like [Uloborus diversus]|uniref:ubiquitin carboxyl-terminal hydrolase 40-like n=1 Tax=Uloborus diversus TaxID=327109 RepID=UPI002409406F|nr:ubiquitin carboxyl-terminal hydrolase 40-like [Uloborus diversus]
MFGSLFDDERPAGVMTNVHTLAAPRPPNRRLPCGLSGIENQGATCYLNSLLQTLLYTPEFREGIFSLTDAELGVGNKERGGKVRKIPVSLQKLFARLLLVDQQAASTLDLTESFGWQNNEELQQHDVQELNRILFSAIDSSLVGTTGKDLISKLYHGTTVTEIVCQNCGKISEKEEDFLDLNVIVQSFASLQDSLNATFLQTEIMKGKNQYRCSICCNLVDAKKGLKIQCLPPILTLSLLRFTYDTVKNDRFKETAKFIFPFEIDMAPYCKEELKPEESFYDLFSILIHSGCSSAGHYHAYIRDVDFLGKWTSQDEDSAAGSKDSMDGINDPVSLVKAILSQQEDNCIPLEGLYGEITKWSGLSWNKKFKSGHGLLVKFLQKNCDVFLFNSSTSMVYLIKDSFNFESSGESSSANGYDRETVLPNSPKETKKNTVINSLKLSFFDKKRAQISEIAVSQYWFDFNDSKVTPIHLKDIIKQYSGQESAYMLFYRQRSLSRPLGAMGNPKYMMPERLVKLTEEDNEDLKRQREEYETAINTITIQVHLGNNYKSSNGVLEPKPGEIHYLDMAIDKRKQLSELRDCVSKLCAGFYSSQECVLHTAREVPAGLHIYDELTESQDFQPIKDLNILDGSKIFIWDGKQIDGESFSVGVAHEPVLLNVTMNLPSGEATELSKGFPKTTTIGEFKMLVGSLLPVPVEELRFSRVDLQGEDANLSPLTENHDGRTLAELSFIDGDNIIIDSIKCENMVVKVNQRLTVCVQNCCKNPLYSDETSIQLIELALDLSNSVEELRELAVSKLNLPNDQSYILRKFIKSQNKRPPLHELQTLKEAGVSDASYVTIEEGVPPTLEQITILFNVGVGIGDTPDFEVTVNKSCTVHECLRQMLSIAGLTGDSWHLKKTNWCGESMEQLSLLEGVTLEDEGIQHGENLLVIEGRMPPKGFLNFSIHLFPTLEMIPNICSMNGLYNSIEDLIQNFGENVTKDDSNRSAKLGEVELSSESTVADLKKYVLTLPSLSTISLPNIRFLRLRLLDNGRPGKILRGLSNTLRKLKMQSQRSLAAQILFKEEDLMQTELLLNVCQRIPDSKSYAPPVELAWDSSKSASPKSLKQAIAEGLACPVERLVIAKRFPERCQWLIIDDGTNSKSNKKKRWGTVKSNLRHSPYFLRDGDTIGVKDRLSDPDDADDFMTPDDIEGQEILKVAAENKRLKRQEEKSPSRYGEWMLGGSDRELPRHAKKSEVGIKIHVEDFTCS